MRLTTFEQITIIETVREFLPDARVMLYGSRTDDNKRGGDIDLLILTPIKTDWERAGEIRWALWDKLGEQKIDILLETEGEPTPFAAMIIHDAIPFDTSLAHR